MMNKLTIKTILLAIAIQLVALNAMAERKTFFDNYKRKPPKHEGPELRPGDGKDKHDPRTKAGESLAGYIYRKYGKVTLPALDVKVDGPFKLKKLKKFLKHCQQANGEIRQVHQKVISANLVPLDDDIVSLDKAEILLHHISIASTLHCFTGVNSIDHVEWAAIYLDSDITDLAKERDHARDYYIDYDKCDNDDRAFLEAGEYQIHYDESHRCHADVQDRKEVSVRRSMLDSGLILSRGRF